MKSNPEIASILKYSQICLRWWDRGKAAKIKGLMEKGQLGARREHGADRAEKRMPEAVGINGASVDVVRLKIARSGGPLLCP